MDQGGSVFSRERWAEIREKTDSFYSQCSDKDIQQMEEQADERRRQRTTQWKRINTDKKSAGYVYLLHHDGLYKIGMAEKLSRRLTQISPVMPHEVTLVHSIKTNDMIGLEAELHEQYASKRMNGEWFALNDKDVQAIKVKG